MKRVAIIGLGLMGGSLGLALKARRLAGVVSAYARRAETRQQALACGAADEVHARAEDAVRGAARVVFCTPVLSIPALVAACVPHLAEGCIATDVGSTKAHLLAQLRPLFQGRGAAFVGSHPMAGSEQTGLAAARADLYADAVVVVTADPDTDPAAAREIARFWEGVGARVVTATAAEHDRAVARSSHLPHLVAAALAHCVGRDGRALLKPFCGPGLRDTTRIAEGSPDMWHDIVKSNREAVLAELRAFRLTSGELEALIEAGSFEAVQRFLEDAKRRREELVKQL